MRATRWSRSQRLLVPLALLATLPVSAFAIVSVASELPSFYNPCFTWGMGNGGTVVASAAGSCTSAGGSSETLPQAILRLILIQGGILFASFSGVVGVVRSNRLLIMAASIVLIFESALFVVDGLFVLTVPPASLFLWSYTRTSPAAELQSRA